MPQIGGWVSSCASLDMEVKRYISVGFDVLTVVVIKSFVFWDLKLCSLFTSKEVHGITSQKTELFG
jgi:hypothetical protein